MGYCRSRKVSEVIIVFFSPSSSDVLWETGPRERPQDITEYIKLFVKLSKRDCAIRRHDSVSALILKYFTHASSVCSPFTTKESSSTYVSFYFLTAGVLE